MGNRRNHALFTKLKKFGCLSNCCYCADRTQNLPGPSHNNVLTVLQISTKSVHFRQFIAKSVKTVLAPQSISIIGSLSL